MYKQAKSFNQKLAGTAAGYCLQNVRRGYGIASKYPTAKEAWNHTQQHKDRNVPTGVDVPLFYTYGTDGHINVRLANGTVWSDGNIYKSIVDYESKKAPDFIGWGESVNDVTVLQYVADTPKLPPLGSHVQLIPTQTRTTWKLGTASPAGSIKVTDNSFVYEVRGYDSKYPGRAIINSASAGGNGVGLALYYVSGALVDGWKVV